MTISGADTVFRNLPLRRYSPRSSHRIDVVDRYIEEDETSTGLFDI